MSTGRMKIGVARKGGVVDTSGYDAVDLSLNEDAEDDVPTFAVPRPDSNGHNHNSFTIDDDDDNEDDEDGNMIGRMEGMEEKYGGGEKKGNRRDFDGESRSSSSSESSDDDYSNDDSSSDDGDDSDISEGTDDSVVDANDSVVQDGLNSSARTVKQKNPLRRLAASPSSRAPPSTPSSFSKRIAKSHQKLRNIARKREEGTPEPVPPAASFRKHLKVGRFPSLSLRNKDQRERGKHQRLSQEDNELELEHLKGADKPHGNGKRSAQKNGEKHTRRFHLTNGNSNGNARSQVYRENDNQRNNLPFKVYDPAQFPLEQFVDAEYGIRNQRPPETYSYSSANPNSIDYEPRSLCKMPDDLDTNNADNKKWERKVIFWGFVTAMCIMMIIMIVTVCSYRNHINVRPPPHDLEDICSMSNISTKNGHLQCEDACKEAMCCMAKGSLSCFEHQKDVCSMYAPCGTIHSNYNGHGGDYNTIVPPAPSNIEEACSDASLVTESGFLECKGACYPGLCCFPSLLQSSLFADIGADEGKEWSTSHKLEIKSCASTHTHVCANYVPCASLEGLEDVHGSAVDLVNKKCTPHNVQYADGKEECENVCQTRSCCFTESKKRNCREDNEVWCNNFKACNYLLSAPDASSVFPGQSPSSNTDDNLQEKCKDPRNLTEDDVRKCQILCDPAVKCCFFLDDVSCHEENVDCEFYNFCEGIANMEIFPTLDHTDGQEDSTVVNELDLKEEDIIVESGGEHGLGGTSPSDVTSACADKFSESCFAACSRYSCCFHSRYDATSCHASKDKCDQVQVCKYHFVNSDNTAVGGNIQDGIDDDDELFLLGIDDKRDPTPSEVINACEGTSADSNACFLSCAKYRCCFEDDFDPISCHSTDFCNQIEVCETMFTTNDAIDRPETHPSEELCSIDNLMVTGGYSQCSNICAGKLCCVQEDGAGGCKGSRPDCADFSACSILLEDFISIDTEGVTQIDANVACSEYKISSYTGKRTCQSICNARECCLDDSCASQHKSDCSRYTACANIDFDDEEYPEPSVNLNTVCTANLLHAGFGVDTSFYTETCLELCEPAQCCRYDTCRHVDDFCVKYVACNNVWDLEDQDTTEQAVNAIDRLSESCTDMSTAEDKATCKDLCSDWECCWGGGELNCFAQSPVECRTATTLCSWI